MSDLTENYRINLKSFDDYRIKVEALLKELLIQNGIYPHKIESRIKDPIKLDEKIIRKNNKYSNLEEITDLVGLRVITFFEDEVDKVAQIIKSEFKIDLINSIDKRQLETDRFGYKSLHYVVSLTDLRKNLTEYKRFKSIKIEIQIRSVLQHAWAEIEHDIGYKGDLTIPDSLKRNFYRVAALLETADIEFVKIRYDQKKYESTIGEAIKKKPEDVEINLTSLVTYMNSSEDLKQIDNELVSKLGWEFRNKVESAESYIEKLDFLNIRTIKELDSLLKKNHKEIIQFAIAWVTDAKKVKGRTSIGISIFYLAYLLVGQRDDKELANKYFRECISNLDGERGGDNILTTYKIIRPQPS